MKRIALIGLLLVGMGSVSYAQTDDIYATGADQRGRQVSDSSRHQNDNGQQNNSYSGDKNAPDNYQSYNNSDDYVDYDDDSYSSRINRFDNSFYNMGYYSTFYNPFWYNPYWVDPYWGYNPWMPGISLSFGFGPYWYGGWGWNTWWGYPGFYSCWNYPFYAGGWYGHYYGGYWNRCYAGIDGGGHRYASNYGPRQTSIGNRMSTRTAGNGFRSSGGVRTSNQLGLRSAPLASAVHANNMGYRGASNGMTQRNNGGGLFRGGNNRQNMGQGGGRGANQSRGGGFRNFFGANGRGGQILNSGRGIISGGHPGANAGGGGARGFGGGGHSIGGGAHSGGGGGVRSGGGGGSRSGGGHSGGGGRR